MLAGCGRIGFSGASVALGEDAPACAHLRCDGFESGTLTGWDVVNNPNARVVVGTGRAHTGARSVEAESAIEPATGSETAINFAYTFGTGTGIVSARAYVSVDQPLRDYVSVLSMKSADRQNYLVVGGDAFGNWEMTQGDPGAIDHGTTVPALVPGSWTCLELEHTAARVRLFVADTVILDFAPEPATFDAIGFGVTRANTTPYRAYIDDVVISDRHVGCEVTATSGP